MHCKQNTHSNILASTLRLLCNHLEVRAFMLHPEDGIWGKKKIIIIMRQACSFNKGIQRDSWGKSLSLGNKTCILVSAHSVQPLYCHCWFAPLIPDGTADPSAAVPSLLWKPWSYLTPLCRQVPCHPAKPHWLPVQRGLLVLMQMGEKSFSISSATSLSFFLFFPPLFQPVTQIYTLILYLMLSGLRMCLDGSVCDRLGDQTAERVVCTWIIL